MHLLLLAHLGLGNRSAIAEGHHHIEVSDILGDPGVQAYMPTVIPKLTKGLMYQGSWGPLQCSRLTSRIQLGSVASKGY